MSKAYVPKALRERIAEQARHRCGYCLTSEEIVGTPMDVEHIFPEALGGQTEEENLWLACSMCNDHKGNRVTEIDPLTGETVQLFNPRRQRWHDHFAWASGGEQIIGLTPVGRATVIALKLNRALLVKAHRVWMRGGVHPPEG